MSSITPRTPDKVGPLQTNLLWPVPLKVNLTVERLYAIALVVTFHSTSKTFLKGNAEFC